ncbi:MAG: sigma-70 family RNA polymerase sigma factor [Clostridia bacterium]|nr:sigma-70 family RNA polymerase sigma factor [Clostridia bacterium]
MVDESKLLRQLKQKQEKSINQAIEIYTPYLSTVLFNMVGNGLPKEDIEEIISDVFVMLWKNAEYIDLEKGTIRSYISTSARNFALKRLNKKSEYISIDDVDLPDTTNFTDDCFDSEQLWKAVMKLGEPDNEIFVRFYRFDEKLKDISKATGLNISTIKTKLSRGKRKLKEILNAEESL